MNPMRPRAILPTHEVANMPPHLGDQDLWEDDAALRDGVERKGGGWARGELAGFGPVAGAAETFEKADRANRYVPEIKSFDRYGMRIDQVAFHPAYHDLMALAIEHEAPNFAWRHPGPGAQVAHAALTYMFSQAEGGVMCPVAMTYAAAPPLRRTPRVGDEWIPKLLATSYDPRDVPVDGKTGATVFREEGAVPAFVAELDAARGASPALDAAAEALRGELADPDDLEARARGLTERMAVVLQGALLARHAAPAMADAFCAPRLGPRWTSAYGALPAGVDFDAILDRAHPVSSTRGA